MHVQADRAVQELPSLVAPISRGLNAAVERLSVVEHSCLSLADAVQPPDLEKALARWGSQPVVMHVSPAQHSTAQHSTGHSQCPGHEAQHIIKQTSRYVLHTPLSCVVFFSYTK